MLEAIAVAKQEVPLSDLRRWQRRRTGRDRQAVLRKRGVEITGDTGVLRWIREKSGRTAVVDFVNDSRASVNRDL